MVVAGLASTVVAIGCGGSSPATTGQPPERGGRLVVGDTADMQSFVPWNTVDLPSSYIASQVFDTLFVPGRNGNGVRPALATAYTLSDGGKTARITLRRGVRFHNGASLTSRDVVFSLKAFKKSPALGTFFAAIRRIEAEGPDAVVLTLSEPQSDLQALLAQRPASILPADYGGMTAKQFERKPIGTGPFRVVSRRAGVEVRLARNDRYWRKGRPVLNALTFKVFGNVNAMSTAMRAGTLDVIDRLPLSAAASFSAAKVTYARPSPQVVALAVNGRRGPLADVRVRQAISHGIDRKALVDGLLDGRGVVADGLVQPAGRPAGTTRDAAPYRYDPALAKRLLAQAVPSGHVSLSYVFDSSNATASALAQALQASLRKVGVDVRLKGLDSAAAVGAIVSGKFDLGQLQPTVDYPAVTVMRGFIALGGYGGGWKADQAQQAQDAYSAAGDAAGQAKAVDAFERYVGSTMPMIALYYPDQAYVSSRRVADVLVDSVTGYDASQIGVAR